MLLDSDQTGLIDLDEFVSGCMQLYGPAKSMQLAKMSYENKPFGPPKHDESDGSFSSFNVLFFSFLLSPASKGSIGRVLDLLTPNSFGT